MVVGSYGDFVFGVSSAVTGEQGVTFNSLTQSTQSRLLTHTTVEGLPIVEFAGVDVDPKGRPKNDGASILRRTQYSATCNN